MIPAAEPRAGRKTAPALAADAIADPPLGFDVAAAPHTTRITGVGGTGVVTLSQILSTAGRIAGRQVRSLDQTGLAQKGGAVISDIKISAAEIEQSNKAVAGECDLYLGCDLLVAADAKNLAVADPQANVAQYRARMQESPTEGATGGVSLQPPWGSALTADEFAAVRGAGFEPVGQVFGAAVYDAGLVCGPSGPATNSRSAAPGSFGPLVEADASGRAHRH